MFCFPATTNLSFELLAKREDRIVLHALLVVVAGGNWQLV
jgi:hypothetical protein